MNDDINSHIESIRKLFVSKLNDLFSWALIEYNSEKLVITEDYHDELDEFKGELIGYIAENKLKIAQLEELMKYFDSKSKKISQKTGSAKVNADHIISNEIDKITIEWADFEMEWDIYE